MTPQEERDQLLASETPAMDAVKSFQTGLGVISKLYQEAGGNLSNALRLLQLEGIINADELIKDIENIPGVPDRFAKPLMQKAAPALIEKLVSQLWDKYVPKV